MEIIITLIINPLHKYKKNIQPFILKTGDVINYQPNDNGPKSKLKAL